MKILRVEADGDWFTVQPESGKIRLRTREEGILPLLPGWTPVVVLQGPAEVCVLGLRHDNGDTAVWFLDQAFRFFTNSLADLSPAAQQELRQELRGGIADVWRHMICAGRADLGDSARHLFGCTGQLIRELADDVGKQIIPALRIVLLETPGELLIIDAIGSGVAGKPVSTAIVQGMFARDFLEDVIATIRDGRLTLPSPIDGAPVATDISFSLNPSTLAYKFYDERNDVVFFVFSAHWRVALTALYFPGSGLLICENPRTRNDFLGFVGGAPDLALFRHATEHVLELDAYLSAQTRFVTIIYIQEHLGHHLYNELGGLDRVVSSVTPEKLPGILLINAFKSEMYGPVDRLYPEIAGKIDRTPHNPHSLARHVYANQFCLVRPTDDYVPAGLTRRIIQYLEADAGPHGEHHAALVQDGFAMVMLGLRVENRTLVDPVGFFCEAIDVLVERLGKVAVVIDGHDAVVTAEGIRMYESHGETIAARSVLETENEILSAIQARYTDRDAVRIVSTIGATMAVTVFWCNRSCLFITPWGAGLAKYRWLCNRPGLVVAGHRFLKHGEHLTTHLYDAREFMEAPTRVVFFTPEDVEDDPSAPVLIGLGDPHRVNYRVVPGAVRQRVLQALATLQPAPAFSARSH